MKRPSIGVVIATPGRRTLLRTINSIQFQGLESGDDVLIMGDGYHKPTAELVEAVGPPFRYIATEKTRDWGHSQQNYGLQHIGGDWLVLQDDDDIFLPRAFDEIRAIVEKLDSPRPIIGRVKTPYLGILWTAPRVEPLDGHCLVFPNDKKKMGYFGSEYEGDQKFLATSLENYETYTWADRVWALTRPHWKLWPHLVSNTPEECIWTFQRDNDGTPKPGAPSAYLMLERKENDNWHARMLEGEQLTEDELGEIAEFAAWAGQGSDVWFEVNPKHPVLPTVLHNRGYLLHQSRPDYMDYTFTWPPHKFAPPEKEAT